MRNLVLSAVAVSMMATPALALSCMPPNIAVGFNWAQDSQDTFVIAIGSLSLTEVLIEPSEMGKDGQRFPTPGTYRADMTAKFLGRTGLGDEHVVPIIVQEECVAHWCGVFPEQGMEMVMILRKDGENYVLDSSPCQGSYQRNPSLQTIRVLKSCMKKGHCSDKQVMSLQQ